MSVPGHQVANHYRLQAGEISKLIAEHRELLGKLKTREEELNEQLLAARRELASVYLRALDDENLDRVARLTGFQGFARRDPRAAREHERKVLQHSIENIESDDRYQRRDLLVGPSGTLTQELQHAREALAPLQAECDRFESLPHFKTLVEIGYDTPAFKEKWWQASYWRHWAAGDRICEELGMRDFGDDVLPAYKKVSEPRDVLAAEVERIDKQISDVHDLVRSHDRLVDRLAHLDEIYLAEAQDFLGEHLANADAALLEEWAKAEPEIARAVQMGVRKIAGLQAKRSILLDISHAGVPQMIEQLEERQRKAYRKYNKFSRPKHAHASFSKQMIDRRFTTKSNNIRAQLDKLEKRIDALMANQNYAGFDLRNDSYLWWWYFMETTPPRYAPAYYDYYQRNPSVQVITDPELGGDPGRSADVARAFAAADQLDRGGYLS